MLEREGVRILTSPQQGPGVPSAGCIRDPVRAAATVMGTVGPELHDDGWVDQGEMGGVGCMDG